MTDQQSLKDQEHEEIKSLFKQMNETDQEQKTEEEKVREQEPTKIDVLNLPPRREVHTHKKGFKLTFNKSFFRIFSVTLMLILAIILIIYSWMNGHLHL